MKLEQKSINILVEKQTSRLLYTLDFVFALRNIDYNVIEVGEEKGHDIHLNYSLQSGFSVPSIECSSLLFSSGLPQHLPEFDSDKQSFVFDEKKDLFASIFFVLTRMEEYLIEERDQHNRFTAQSSLQTKYGILNHAICDRWATKILDLLAISVGSAKAIVEPTFDIDNAFAYKYKTGTRRKLSLLRDVLQQNKARIQERKSVDFGGRDPYDTYEIIQQIAVEVPTIRIFWLTESKGKFDRNVSLNHPEIKALIKRLDQFSEIGIHPSYNSFGNSSKLKSEISRLEDVVGSHVTTSRQHFLRFSIPESFKMLLESGVTDDYSMCFADHYGFRCGTARSIPWFDLTKNEVTKLTIHPFVYMDGTLNEYLKLSIKESKKVILDLYREVSAYGGVFRFIWHNETIGDYGIWQGWSEVLNFTIDLSNE